jgi:hypothetical protein
VSAPGRVPPIVRHAVTPIGGCAWSVRRVGIFSAILVASLAVGVHRRRSGEPVALVVADELVVDETLLVHVGALLVELGLGTVALGLLLGDARVALGEIRLLVAVLRLAPMPRYGPITSLIDLALTGASTASRDHHHQRHEDQDDYDNDDYDQYSGRHTLSSKSWG